MSGTPEKLQPMHPGELLREEFLAPLGLSALRVARAAGVPRTRIERILREKTGVSADTALRLGKVLGTTPEFWINLQTRYDMLVARAAIAGELAEISVLVAAA